MKTVLVTGGAGFIGSAVVRRLIHDTGYHVVNVDVLTYAGNLDSLASVADDPRYTFERVDVRDAIALRRVFAAHTPSAVLHLAAETHVDRSIDGPAAFVETNVVGTFTLLNESLRYWRSLAADARDRFRFVHVSTDEVFGSLGETGRFTESTPYAPNSPYSASKAGADHLVRAWHHTYGLPTVTTNSSNNYGPFQFPEKLIPLVIQRALSGQSLPVYGRGENVRDWLYVDDHVSALLAALERGAPGESYNVGGDNERRNIDVVRALCVILDELRPTNLPGGYASLIQFVTDRPGHDLRYAIDSSRIERSLGWSRAESFESGLRKTVLWYLENATWIERVQSGQYRGERLGLESASVGPDAR